MWHELEQRNRSVWEQHSSILQDATHVVGGIGLGLLLFPVMRRQARTAGWVMLMASAALHMYADTIKPRRSGTPAKRAARERTHSTLSF